jgi:hypothetical protein
MSAEHSIKGQPLADLMFGSWEQGFHKPHNKVIKKDVNMFNQPFRQHWNVALGKGHQVFNHRVHKYRGPTKGDDWIESPDEEEEEK